MGLDVTLNYCDDWPKKLKLEKEFQALVEEKDIEWGTTEWENLNDKMGLIDGYYPTSSIELNSNTDPEHLFKVGYFRSSYNQGGINSVMRTRIGKSLYDVFPESEDYYFVPNWARALINIREIRKEFEDSIAATGKYQVATISTYFVNEDINSPQDALNAYMEEINSRPTPINDSEWYMNKVGEFFNLKARAVMNGSNINRPCTYLIYESTDQQDWDWYVKALKIVEETILWVLEQDDPNNYGLSWSA
jgi:hypothetical protein